MQPDKLYFSWNRFGANAPHFDEVKGEFAEVFANLIAFVSETFPEETVKPNLWEIQYVNQIPQGDLWNDPRDWHRVLPTFFPKVDPSIRDVRFATYSGEWHFEIEPKMGRIHVRVAKMVMNQEKTPTLYLSLTARGEIGEKGSPDMQSGLELGHDSCIRLFIGLTSPEAHKKWGLTS